MPAFAAKPGLEALEASKRARLAVQEESEPVAPRFVAAGGEQAAFEAALLAGRSRGRDRPLRRIGGLLLRPAAREQRRGQEQARANSRRR
ncbi:MAG TPA: hypothetical protein VF718_12095 [Allosphingosinicella sp.]|jgi:hypothetical protein